MIQAAFQNRALALVPGLSAQQLGQPPVGDDAIRTSARAHAGFAIEFALVGAVQVLMRVGVISLGLFEAADFAQRLRLAKTLAPQQQVHAHGVTR